MRLRRKSSTNVDEEDPCRRTTDADLDSDLEDEERGRTRRRSSQAFEDPLEDAMEDMVGEEGRRSLRPRKNLRPMLDSMSLRDILKPRVEEYSSEEEPSRRTGRKTRRLSDVAALEDQDQARFETYSTRYGRLTRRAVSNGSSRRTLRKKLDSDVEEDDRGEIVGDSSGGSEDDGPVFVRRTLRKRQNVERYSPTRADNEAQALAYNTRSTPPQRNRSRRFGRYRKRSRYQDSDDGMIAFGDVGRNHHGGLFRPSADLFIQTEGQQHQDEGAGLATPMKAAAARIGIGMAKSGLFEKEKNSEITPVHVDPSVTFAQIGGLSHYIKALKEMIFLPLVYPEVFDRFRISPPRGVLLYGPPGTGKTLTARALAATASKAGKRVTFFMRKGADILSKWVGEAERQLRMLFEEAQKHQPSIIFFDEIDGLAPVRSSRQDQIHNSIVSTLLALMDGLDARGQVVVIGATNRIDAIDGALRRPGRFDRELLFPLPNAEAREEILDIHTNGWVDKPDAQFRRDLAASCVGYCGADLKALCTEAAVRSLRRGFPQIYETDKKLLVDPGAVKVSQGDFLAAQKSITPAAHRSAILYARPLPLLIAPLLVSHLECLVSRLKYIFPPAYKCIQVEKRNQKAKATSDVWNDDFFDSDSDEFEEVDPDDQAAIAKLLVSASQQLHATRPRLLVFGESGAGQAYIAPALLHALEMFPVHAIGIPSLLSNASARSPEEALVYAVAEARRAAPAILYLPHLQLWWEMAPLSLRTTLWVLLQDLPPSLPLLLLATADVALDDIDQEARDIFGEFVYELSCPTQDDRTKYFGPLAEAAYSPVRPQKVRAEKARPPSLPEAPITVPEPSKDELRLKALEEEQIIRRLRMALREIVLRLLDNRKWAIFAEPPEFGEEEVVPDACLDLSNLLCRIDDGWYLSVNDFQQEVDKFVQEVKAMHGEEDVHIVSKAHALNDTIKEMIMMINPEIVKKAADIAQRGGPLQCDLSMPAARETFQSREFKLSRSSRLRGESIDKRALHEDPEALARRLREQKRFDEQLRKAEEGEEELPPACGTEEKQAVPDENLNGQLGEDVIGNPSDEEQKHLDQEGKHCKQALDSTQEEPDGEVISLAIAWKQQLVLATSGYSVESLEKVHAEVSRLLLESRKTKDRKLVVLRLKEYLASKFSITPEAI